MTSVSHAKEISPATGPGRATLPADAVEQVEHALSTHPELGDSARIERRVVERYRFGLEILSDHLPSLGAAAALVSRWPAEEARRFFLDPGLRLALEDALARLERGTLRSPDPLEGWLPAALAAHRQDPRTTYTESRACPPGPRRVGPERSAWVGQLDQASDPRLQELRANLAASLPSSSTCLAATPALLEQLDRACSLLAAVLPRLGPAVLRHIAAIGVIETRLEEGSLLSASGGDVAPSTMVVSPRQLENPWDAAGHLLHEGLHLKLFDVARAQSFLREPDVLVDIPWRSVQFTMARVVFSFHVYVHMLLFRAAVDGMGARCFETYGEPRAVPTRAQPMSVVRNDDTARFGRSIDRTRFLHQRLSGPWARHLSPDGARLVDWLVACVERIEPAVRA
jgi:hypothetical protein